MSHDFLTSRIMLWMLLGMALFPGADLLVSSVETRYFHVVENTKLVSVDPDEDGVYVSVVAETDKVRNCDFKDIDWFLGRRGVGNSAKVSHRWVEGSKVKGPGRLEFGPLILHLTQDDLLNNSYADVYHTCGLVGGLVTRTVKSRLYN